MFTPVISISMPAYNVEKYIGEAIESILAQTFTDWELIIVDDCSKDKTLAIASEYAAKDSRIRIIKRKENSGTMIFLPLLVLQYRFAEYCLPKEAFHPLL